MHGYVRPDSLEEALTHLGEQNFSILSGGTDLYPASAARAAWGEPALEHPLGPPVLDVGGLDELRDIRVHEDHFELGALVTWSDVCASSLPPGFDALREAAREIGGQQIQNRGTVIGNLCNASPAADGIPALLVLDASVRLASQHGTRVLSLEQFVLGNRKTALMPGEMVISVLIPRPPAHARSTFLKLGARRYLVISIAMIAVYVELVDDHIANARIAVGACSEVAARLLSLESRLAGRHGNDAARLVSDSDFAHLAPQDDARARAWYRREAAATLVQRALAEVCGS